MIRSLLPVRTLLLAIFVLMAGSGFLSTLIAIRLSGNGASNFLIGLAATSYFSGLAIGAFRVTGMIARIGHIRAFAAFVTIYSASSLTYAIVDFAPVWIVLRMIDGFVMSGVFVCLESWLNRVARADNRSAILAAYMVALYAGQAIGQFLLNLGDNSPSLPFMVSSILLSLALLPIVLTHIEQPTIEKTQPFTIRRLYAASPLGIIGTLVTGMMLGAFYALGAVFAQRVGLSLAEIALFSSCVISGGVVLQYPLGLLSDRFDRRRVILACMVLTGAVAGALAFVKTAAILYLFGAVFGGFAFALYPLNVAHANDRLDESERVGASSGLILVYSVGAVIGPQFGSAAMSWFGPAGLFGAIASIASASALFGFWRSAVGEAVASEDQQDFRALPRTTPMASVLEDEE